MKTNIYIVSYGICPYRDISIKALKILKKCSEVYVLMSSSTLASFLSENSIKYTDITYIYSEGKKRTDVYNEIARFVIKRAEKIETICYFTYGDPMLFDSPSQLIIEAAKSSGLSVSVIPGISFVNFILASLQISIGTEGIAVYEATRLVRDKIAIDKRVHCLVAQVGTFNSEYVNRSETIECENLSLLVDYLRIFYPANHLVTLCHSDSINESITSIETPLCLIPLFAESTDYSTTLYIPRLVSV